jgi:thioredoxin-like negative regulator of GroEL
VNDLIQQSKAYWALGMIGEARGLAREALALERDACGGDTTGPAAEWCAHLAFDCGNFESVAARGLREPRFPESSHAIYSIATALHFLGRHEEAVEVLAPRARAQSRPHDHYQVACFLSQAGRADEAVEHLFQSLPHFRRERRETWIDGDLKHLWPILAEGRFSMATAHRLVEVEFDILREWQPARKETWVLDPSSFNDLPSDLRPLCNPVPLSGEHRIIPREALAAPELAERFEQWARDEIAASQRAFDDGRGIALRRVLDAQAHYAQAAWNRGDLCALRYHVHWAVRNDPARIHDFTHIAGIEPLLDEVGRMQASDTEFFAKLERAALVSANDTDAALEIIESLPREWSDHPLILLHRAAALMLGSQHGDALALLLRVCGMWPDDAAPFLNAAWSAIKAGRSEMLATIRARTPRAAHAYRSWTGVEGWLSYIEVKSRPFRGQPDLGGHLSREITAQVALMAA